MIPLHNHSMYSALDGFSTPDEIADRCVEIGCPSCGLTDHGVVSGHLAFAKALTERDIKPIFGCELYHGLKTTFKGRERDQAHLIALAKTDEGLKNLWRLTDCTAQENHFHNVGRVFWDDLEKYKEGLIITSACIQGLVPQGLLVEDTDPLNRYLDIFGDDFYIEISTYPSGDIDDVNNLLMEIAMERGIPMVYCNPAEAPIWMSDLSFKPIGEIEQGDSVVGWSKQAGKYTLCDSEVLSISKSVRPVVRVTMASGRVIRCTSDHKWLTASWGGPKEGGQWFCPPEIGRRIVHVIDPSPVLSSDLQQEASWLGGIFDGEGWTDRAKPLSISQSTTANPLVCARIEQTLDALGFTYQKHNEKDYHILGGKQTTVDFANWTHPTKIEALRNRALVCQWRTPDTVVSIEPDGEEPVYGLTTTTGNYVAWGYASKNSNDAHYAFPSQFEAHDMYLALQTGQTIFTPIDERTMYHPPEAVSMMDEATVRDYLSHLPQTVVDECIANSILIAEHVTADLPEVRRHLPLFVPADCPWLTSDSKALSAEELFIDLVEEGIVFRYGESASDEVWDRALSEMEILLDDGIHHYFLMGWDEVQFAVAEEIEMGPGRGSSAGCIVSYALGITDVDPLHYGLIFERFWNSGRAKGFPDIDSDFSRGRRQEVIAYLKERWGTDRVQAIGTTGYMKPKSVCDKLSKGFGLTFEENAEIKEIIGKTTKIEILGHDQIGWDPELEPGKVHYVKRDCGEEIEKWIDAKNDRKDIREHFIRMCEICCSRVKQYGIHASGIVIGDVPLAAELPTYRRGGKLGVPATMFTMADVDERMLVKLDVLGLRTLDSLEYWRSAMAEKGIDIVWSGLDKEEHPDDMWQMLHDGFTAGIFQVEDGYGRQLCKRMEPRSVEDLSVLNALNRPGPIQAGIPDQYIDRRLGLEEVTYSCPEAEAILDPILSMTHGLFVYQEQIIAYFNAIGYTKSESDAMRKIMGKKQPQDLAAIKEGTGEWEGRGYMVMAVAAGLPEYAALSTWNTIEGFADYCFNKSHTVCYAAICLRTLFAKFYSAAEFYAACMHSYDPSKDRKDKAKMAPQFVNEARRLKIPVEPPHIYKSRGYSHVDDDGTWYFGFEDVLKVGHSGEYIVGLRDINIIDMATPEKFDETFTTYNESVLADRKARQKNGEVVEKDKSPKQQLQANKIQALYDVGAWQKVDPDERTMTEQQQVEQELLGVILTDNIAEVLECNGDEINTTTDLFEDCAASWDSKVSDEDDEPDFIEYAVCGIVTGTQEKHARASGKAFGIVTIGDPLGDKQIEFAVFGNKWKSHKFLFRVRTPGIFTVRHQAPNQYGESYLFEKGRVLKS